MTIKEHFNKDNLHHAYLIEGRREEIVPEILQFCESLDIKTSSNPDFCHITIDNFKIDEAFDLRAMSFDKSFSKKIFLICVNSFSADAQNVLLKMFEEPIKNTHFFLVVPDIGFLLKTLVSRFYLISARSARQNLAIETREAEKFINLPLQQRIDFIKKMLVEPEEDEADLSFDRAGKMRAENGNKISTSDSARSKALKFLNALEDVLHKPTASKKRFNTVGFEHFFKVREFLRMPGSSTKILMESVALIIPEKYFN